MSYLTIAVQQIVDMRRIPKRPKLEQPAWPETVLGHDDEVGEEARAGLDAADDAVSHGKEAMIDQSFRAKKGSI